MPSLTISTPGTHILSSNLTNSGTSVINIDCDNVVLDLNGNVVASNPSNPSTAATFAIMCPNRSNITIKNGTVTGAFFGIHAGYSSNVLVENVNLSGNTYIGLAVGGEGFGGNIVRGCTFNAITGYTPEAYAIAINGLGPNGLVENCTFSNLYKQPGASGVGEGVGVLISSNCPGTVVRNSTFSNSSVAPNTIAIWVAGGSSAEIYGNDITNFKFGVQGDNATIHDNILLLEAALTGSVGFSVNSGTATNNSLSGYEALLAGGIVDGGGNNTSAPPPPSNIYPVTVVIDGITYTGQLTKTT